MKLSLLKECPMCLGDAHIMTECDYDMVKWYFVECSNCKLRTRGKFASETCPQFYAEVRDEWNVRKSECNHQWSDWNVFNKGEANFRWCVQCMKTEFEEI